MDVSEMLTRPEMVTDPVTSPDDYRGDTIADPIGNAIRQKMRSITNILHLSSSSLRLQMSIYLASRFQITEKLYALMHPILMRCMR